MVQKEPLIRYANAIHELRSAHPQVNAEQPTLFFRFLMPWLLEPIGENRVTVEKGAENERVVLTQLGFPGEVMANEVRTLFKKDAHLSQCCPNPLALGYVLDKYFVRPAADLIAEKAIERLDDLFANFQKTVYEQGPYTLVSYSHIFNLDSPLDRIDIGPVRVQKLSQADIVGLLGEPVVSSAGSFLQPPNVGAFFLVQEERGAGKNESEWFVQHHFRAMDLFRIVQYSKDGVAHIDYSVPQYRPLWVNELSRNAGLFFFGMPRQIAYQGGNRLLSLQESDLHELTRWMGIYLSEPIVRLIADETSVFRRASLRAGEYFEKSLSYDSPVERLIALAIALESIFSPGDSSEYSFRISQTASQLVGDSPASRREIYDDLRQLYTKRSKIMHGTYDVQAVAQGTDVTHDELDRWSAHVKKGLLAMFTLFLRGKRTEGDLRAFRNDLLMGALDAAVAEQVRSQADMERFLTDCENGLV